MRLLAIILFFLIYKYTVFCQTNNKNSNNLYNSVAIENIEILIQSAKKKLSDSVYKSLQIVREADSLIKYSENIDVQADVYSLYGKIYRKLGAHDKALQIYDSLLDLGNKNNQYKYKGQAFNNIGLVYFNMGRFDKAIEYYNKALPIKESLNDRKGKAITLNNIGNAYFMFSDFENAIINYQRAQQIFEEEGHIVGVISTLNGIGSVYESMANYKMAIVSYQKAYSISLENGKRQQQANLLSNIGTLYSKRKQNDTALVYYNRSLVIQKDLNDLSGIAGSYNNIGIIYRIKGEYDKAIEFYNKAMEINRSIDNRYQLCLNYHAIGKCFNDIDEKDEALKNFNISLKLSETLDIKEMLYQNYKELSHIYYTMGEFKQAFEYNNLYANIKDTIYDQQIQEKITELQTQYDTERKEKEIQILAKENEVKELKLDRNRNYIFGLIGFIIIAISFGILLIMQYRLKERNKRFELEQKLFRSQMNPHFIFNTLIAIQSFIFKNDPLEAGKFLSDFAKLMRHILDNSREEFIPLDKEIDMLTQYLTMQKLRFNSMFDFSFQIKEGVNPELIAIPPMISQPFIENSVEHGLRNKKGKGYIIIKIEKMDNNLLFEIIDNGIGREASMEINQKREHRSLATSITKERLDLYNQKHRSQISLEIVDLKDNDKPAGTKVVLNIPIKYLN